MGNNTPRWWTSEQAERSWFEIRGVEHDAPPVGTCLTAPTLNRALKPDPRWVLLHEVRSGDIIYHWVKREQRIVGTSIVRGEATVRRFGAEERLHVDLDGFTPLAAPIDKVRIQALEEEIRKLRDRMKQLGRDPAFLPFQFRADGIRFVSNYFAKAPNELIDLLLGEASVTGRRTFRGGYLQPFRSKADTQYLTQMSGSSQMRTRAHETLVNGMSDWLEQANVRTGRNAAIDLAALGARTTLIEGKIVDVWADSIRQAIGQLYEYRYFQVVDPRSHLIFLADRIVPNEWIQYLEQDRHVGVAWPQGRGFHLSRLARKYLDLQ